MSSPRLIGPAQAEPGVEAVQNSHFFQDMSASAVMSSSAPVAEYFPNERTDIPGSGGAAPPSLPVAPPNARPQYMDPSTLYLTVTIGSGHSFADALLDSECSGPKPPLLSLVASFLSRRFTTQRVAYTADPAFRGQTTFTLPDMRGVYAPLAPPAGVIAASAEAPVSAEGARLEPYLAVAEPLKFLLLRHPPEGGPAVVAASARCDWRPVLVHGRLEHDLVLTADASDLTLGIVPLRLALSPLSAAGAAGSAGGAPAVPALVPAATVARRIAADQRAEHDRHTQQQVFARAWWLRLERRLPPPPRAPAPQLYARDEFGSLRLACTFVRPADLAEGCLDTALHAARFVRLMPHAHLSAGPSGERARHWRSVPAFLAAGAGSALEHALLLCSLLLGFGLDAYVATGTAALPPAASEAPPTAAAAAAAAAATGVASPYSWVVTVSPSTGAATFWDAVTGRTYACRRGAPLPFTALSSLFRHDAFYACLRPDAAPAELSYALAPPAADAEDAGEAALVRGDGCWFAFPQEAIRATGPVLPLLIQKSSFSAGVEAHHVESQVKEMLAAVRRAHVEGLETPFCAKLGRVLQPLLWAYEMEPLLGYSESVDLGQDLTKQAIEHSTTPDTTFVAIPFQFAFADAGRIVTAMLKKQAVVDLLRVRHPDTRFAFRVKLHKYPENVFCLWAVIAADYPSLQ